MEAVCSRRGMLKGAAMGAAAAGFAAIAPVALAEGEDAQFDRECDLLVVGFGLAGAAAALEANDIDPDAKVIVIEKMDEAQAGGNSIASGQTVIVPSPDDIETFKTYVAACFEPNPIPEEYLDWMCNEFASQVDWIQGTVSPVGYEIGYVSGGPLSWGKLVTEFPDLAGSNFIGCSGHVRQAGGTFENGGVWRGIKVPDYESTFMRNFTMPAGSWIEVDAEDKRFYNESGAYHRQHMKYKQYGHYVDLPHDRALPVHLIFDDKTCQAGSIVTKWLSWPTTTLNYVWSDDNSAEIEKGWIVKADTIDELAELIGRNPAALQLAIDTYNEGVEAGKDEFGRDPETMALIDTPPYYAVGITPTLVGTTGGAKRDTQARVLRWDGTPIEGLYEAGELGSYVANLYQNGMFLAECIASGRAAADTAFGGRSAVSEPAPTENLADLIDITKKADGVYTQVINGNEGKFTIQVTVEGGAITDVQVIEGRDNMFMTDELLQQYVDTVVDNQVVVVDGISGATLDINKLNQGMTDLFADTAK